MSLPAIAAPKGGGAIRSIGETFRANPVTGTGALAVPLPLSSSRGGAGPKLTLSYDSGQGQGPFGMGWSVDLPSITRRTDKGLPQYRDPDESDEFVLSGAEVLVPALVQNGSGWQREAFDDGAYHVVRYRPRIEGAFARIERRTDRATGEVHWRTITRDNVTSIFGKSPSARLADPKNPWKVFRWLLEATFDDRGNVTWFEYKAEDTASVPQSHVAEKTRLADPQSFANQYVKRIHYGNRTALATADPTVDDLRVLAWLFEVVFDYGEHDADTPTLGDAQPWPCRQDPFSSFRATFDIRTYRLCQRILMFHRFDELGPAAIVVRSLDLAYEPSPTTTYLRSITETGWQATTIGYTKASMPRLDFDYTRAELRTAVQAVGPESVVHMPGGVDGSGYRFIDLDGEGIPGVLTQQGGALFYKRSEGGGHFGLAQALAAKPNVATLGASGQMLTSLDADGRMDLVLLGTPPRGYLEREEDGWSPFRSFARGPSFDPADPNLRFLDVDGDGLADMIVAEDEAFVWSRSLGKDGFDRPQVVRKRSDEDVGPNFVFADASQSIFLADITGDGLVDLVRVRNGEICYWPNLGYGRFGAKITMGVAPHFDRPEAFDPKRLRFGDVDGSGTSDIAYVRPDGVALYLNQAGNRWSDPVLVRGAPGGADTTIELVDLLGTGTSCLVWSSPERRDAGHPIRYVDLLASTKPHLLTRVVNNLGLETRVAYAPSTHFYLEDRAAGSPWVTRLPFPVQVIARIETADAVQKTRLVTTYRYKHGYFDGFEREFRGFGLVEQWDAESYSSAHGAGLLPPGLNEQNDELLLPPVHTKTWFDTGAWREARDLFVQYRKEWYALDPKAARLAEPGVPAGLTTFEVREAARARKGTLLRHEVYADDGSPQAAHPYAVEEHRHEVVALQPMAGVRHPVLFTHEVESVAWHYERNPGDPRVEHAFTLEVDDYGNILRSAQVAYPRCAPAEPEQGVLLVTCADATFVNETAAFYRLGVPVEARGYELTGLGAPASGLLSLFDVDTATTSAAPIPFEATPTAGALQKRLVSHHRTLYLRDDISGPLPLGSVAPRALVYEAYAKALTTNLLTAVFAGVGTPSALAAEGGYVNLDGDWWRPSGRPTYDVARFYRPIAITDPFGNTARIVLDVYGLLPVETHGSADVAIDNVVLASNDYRVLRPAVITDPNGNQTAAAFDPLGMVVATAVMGKGEGDTLDDPTTRTEYDLLSWQSGQGPASVHAFAREKHGAANPRWQETYAYSDGSGHEVMRKVQAEPAPGTNVPRWVGSGRTVLDNKGNPVKQYEPYFSTTPAYEDEPSIAMQGVTPILRYDPLGRLVRTDLPNGTFETTAFDAWSATYADANDNVLESAWYAKNEALPPTDPERSAADAAAKHAHTPTVRRVDPLGRTFLKIEDNGPAGAYATRTALDIQGNVRSVTDARGIPTLTQTFDLEGRVLDAASVDAGDRKALHDVAENPFRSWDGRGFAVRTEYDALRRPLRLYVTPPGGAEILAERLVYGEAIADGTTSADNGKAENARGRKVLHYDGAGELYLSSYDFQGNLTTATRTLAGTYQETPNWKALATLTDAGAIRTHATPLLEPESFTTTSAYDALDRLVSTITPDTSTVVPTYNEANLLERVRVYRQGSTTPTTFVDDIDYDAKGQRLQIIHGDDGTGHGTTSTVYVYDPLTFRLTQLTTTRASDGAVLQSLSYAYDPVGNVTAIADGAQQAVFFNGAVVTPSSAYIYDAIYRLIQATGREQAGGSADVPRDLNDVPILSLPDPNDTNAVRNYRESYVYDAVGNLLQMTHTAIGSPMNVGTWTQQYGVDTASNRLLGPQYAYDACGNMTEMPHLPTIGWDWRGQMVSADRDGGGIVYFAYDATGQRVRKVWEHSGLIEERVYLGEYELYRRRAASAGASAVERQTLHVMDGVRRIALVETTTADASAGGAFEPGTVTRFQLGNHLGSSVLELDEHGKVISYEEYHPYGTTAYHSGTGAAEVSLKRYRYAGKERDEETGLYYHGARYHAPWLARWVSADPLPDANQNHYVFVRCNPVGLVDPDGRQPAPAAAPDARLPLPRLIIRFDLSSKAIDRSRRTPPPEPPTPPSKALPPPLAPTREALEAPGAPQPPPPSTIDSVRESHAAKKAGGMILGGIQAAAPGGVLANVVKHPDKEVQFWRGVGESLFGVAQIAVGVAGVIAGGIGTGTGGGAVAGIPLIAASVGVVALGVANVMAGIAMAGAAGRPEPSLATGSGSSGQGSGSGQGNGSGSDPAPSASQPPATPPPPRTTSGKPLPDVTRLNLPPAQAQELAETIEQIEGLRPPPAAGTPKAAGWGSEFRNFPRGGRPNPDLPRRPPGYYREYTVLKPGATDRGSMRVVSGRGGELFFTENHYGQGSGKPFTQIR